MLCIWFFFFKQQSSLYTELAEAFHVEKREHVYIYDNAENITAFTH